jgi:tRNA-dihydrouridine synthase B
MQRPIVALSPMADMTDSTFCRVVKSLSSPIVFREMVSSEAVIRGNDKTMGMAEIHHEERPLVQQIFGANPENMAESARIIERDFHPEGFDINMGCPVYKITSNFNGAALMKNPELATNIVKSMKAAISVPLSVKMRAGWSDHEECIDFSKQIEEAGASLITVHGRTKMQGYAGLSNRDVVRRVKEAVSIPVLYNGDVFTWQDYFKALDETGCDGVLIARGALGNPWIFKQIQEKLNGKEPEEVTLEERIRVVRMHLNLHLNQYGDDRLPTFRKHLSWYFKGLPHFKQFRQEMMTAPDEKTLDTIFDTVLKTAPKGLTL